MSSPRHIQTLLLDGTLEGIHIIEPEGDINAYVIPRLKLNEANSIDELNAHSVYLLLNADDATAYIGQSASFTNRVIDHLRSKDWWTLAVVIVSSRVRGFDKSDITYLESLLIKRAREGTFKIDNKVMPSLDNIHEFNIHKLERIADDIDLVLSFLGYGVLTGEAKDSEEQVWHCKSKLTNARAVYRGDQFVVLAGSRIDKSHTPSFEKEYYYQVTERQRLFSEKGVDRGGYIELTENAAFKSPNHAGHIVTGRSVNAWKTWKNADGQTMDEVMRKGDK